MLAMLHAGQLDFRAGEADIRREDEERGHVGILGFNEKNKEIIISSTEISPLQSNTFAVNTKNGKTRLIGKSEG
ncbi:MAG: hypothetical protein J6K32_09035, partial [Clostridia bacterium]|nr:hypothetical protein [Clostridia bacterium]